MGWRHGRGVAWGVALRRLGCDHHPADSSIVFNHLKKTAERMQYALLVNIL